MRSTDRMGRPLVGEVHHQAVVDHHAGEATEHTRSVRRILATGAAGDQVGVELGRRDVQPPGLRPDLVGGLVDVDHLSGTHALSQRLEKARFLETASCLGHERGDKAGRDLDA